MALETVDVSLERRRTQSMKLRVPEVIYFDARALQDPDYRFRGVGQHASCLVEALRLWTWPARRPRLVAITQNKLEELHFSHRRLFDTITNRTSPDIRLHASGKFSKPWYVSLSPMTHDPIWASAFLQDPEIYKVALFYDLIPMNFPERYLRSSHARMDYHKCLAWLQCYDVFAAISRFTANELIDRLAIGFLKVFVSGVAVRKGLEPKPGQGSQPRSRRSCILVSGGGDPRKNPECAIVACASSQAIQNSGLPLKIIGNYPESMRADFRKVHAQHGGRPQSLQFQQHLSDDALHNLYCEALVTIVPSRAEGFSIPIVESSAAGTPVLASDVGAHPELIRQAACRFHPDEPGVLRHLIEQLLADEDRWAALQDSHSLVWTDFTVERVGERTVDGLMTRAPEQVAKPIGIRRTRPAIAVMSPMPPTLSGVADYTAATLAPLTRVADVHVFTPTVGARFDQDWASMRPMATAAFSAAKFDATISVMGNSSYHTEVLDYLLDYGGACIAHDARQIDFYFHERGPEYARLLAERELGRSVSIADVAHWINNQRDMETLFLSELVKASSPLIVHSPITACEIDRLYGKKPVLLPYAHYRSVDYTNLHQIARAQTRSRLGIRPSALLLVTFGIVSRDKAPDELIWCLKTLRDWGIDAELVLCGTAPGGMPQLINELSADLGLTSSVKFFTTPVGEELYRDYLIAADIGIQLRTYFMGGLSGALNDCIVAALPSIANEHLAEAMDAPDFVRRVPDNLSSILISEAVLDIMNGADFPNRPLDEARDFANRHTPTVYCKKLLESLEVDVMERDLA